MVIFLFATASSPGVSHMQPLIRWVPGGSYPNSPPFNADVKNAWKSTSTPPVYPHGLVIQETCPHGVVLKLSIGATLSNLFITSVLGFGMFNALDCIINFSVENIYTHVTEKKQSILGILCNYWKLINRHPNQNYDHNSVSVLFHREFFLRRKTDKFVM
jgi:hypothetical protein